jgi:hypothetical protein
VAEQLIQNQLVDQDEWKFIRLIKRMDLGGRSAPLAADANPQSSQLRVTRGGGTHGDSRSATALLPVALCVPV